jgi:hypothetical protein
MREDIGWAIELLKDAAHVQDADFVAHLNGFVDIVGNKQDRLLDLLL